VSIQAKFQSAMFGVGCFEPAPHIAVAVSGGADSMALCMLAHAWARACGGTVTALIVDHRLRVESTHEAQQVADSLQSHGIASVILTLEQDFGCTSIQEKARKFRYDAMIGWCVQHGVLHLLTGHHADDQRETVLMRMVHGAGLRGMCGIASPSYRQDIRILRPLLRASKQECMDYLLSLGMAWVEDASNAKPLYQRNRLRMVMGSLEDEGWSLERSIKLVDNFQRSESFIECNVAFWLAHYAQVMAFGALSLNYTQWRKADEELRIRILTSCLSMIHFDGDAPRMRDVLALNERLLQQAHVQKYTLNGCLVLVDNSANNIFFCREIARVAKPLCLSKDSPLLWDGRFVVRGYDMSDDASEHGYCIDSLGAQGVTLVRKKKVKLPALPVEVLRTIPAIWQGEGLDSLIAVPHIGYYSNEKLLNHVEILWNPVCKLAD
jgi:tRNA(Ile)-lysidine synthase